MHNELSIEEIDKKASEFEKRLTAAGFNINEIAEYAQMITVGVLKMMDSENIDIKDAIENLSNMDI